MIVDKASMAKYEQILSTAACKTVTTCYNNFNIRLFNLSPNPGMKWRFVKIDSQNLIGIFGRNTLQKQAEKRPFDFTQRSFWIFQF